MVLNLKVHFKTTEYSKQVTGVTEEAQYCEVREGNLTGQATVGEGGPTAGG